MPDNNNQTNNQSGNQSNNQSGDQANNQAGNQSGNQGKEVILGCDSNGANDAQFQSTVAQVIEGGGYKVTKLGIGPNEYATYSYESGGGKLGVYLMAASLISYLDAGNAKFDFNVMGIRGDITSWGTEEGFKTKGVPKDHHGDCTIPECDTWQNKTYVELNQQYKPDKVQATWGETAEKLGQNILAALGGKGTSGGGTSTGSGAQIKDKTFEKCIRRICAATDSVFLVESNAAVLFPYVDWMAFTLRQKINTIKSNEIDPNVFTMEYGNEGFYNKVSIAWGGATLPERYPKDEDGKPIETKKVTNYTSDDILENMRLTNFNYDSWLAKQETKNNEETDTNSTNNNANNANDNKKKSTKKKAKTTQEIEEDENGNLMLSEQYDALVDIYGELEKRVESDAPDFETAQYIVNALLIQYIRDYNNSCKCRALNVRKYIGGTFYAVENPFTKESELYYLNSYTLRTQKDEPMYHDLDFRYGPEGAEELLDYQTYGGGGGGGTADTGAGSATEQQIWERAKVPCHQWSCGDLRVSESDTEDPKAAEDYYNKMAGSGQKFCLTCYGMSAFLHYEFNQKANIPCQVVGDSGHHVVMIDRKDGKGMVETREEYRQLDQGYRWKSDQVTTVLLPASASGGGNNNNTSGGNTNQSNTNGGNRS